MNITDKINEFIERVKEKIRHKRFGEFGKLAILIGQRKTGKSETVKKLCRNIKGYKYIIKPDENLKPLKLTVDERNDWKKIPKCHILEEEKDLPWNKEDENLPITFIFEDFPMLTHDATIDFYNNLIKDTRHIFYNVIIVAHAYDTIPKQIFNQANFLLLYNNANITQHQLAHKVGGLTQGWAIHHALQDLELYKYYLISFDFNKWHNPPLDSREVNTFKEVLTMNKEDIDKIESLVEIEYKRKTSSASNPRRNTKKQEIEQMIEQGKSYGEILKAIATSEDYEKTSRPYIWKIKCYMREKYRQKHELRWDIPEDNYPEYLRDNRRREGKQ